MGSSYEQITSLQNWRIKEAIQLRNRSERDATQLFLIEGYREVRRAMDAGWPIEQLFYCPELFLGENEEQLLDEAQAAGTFLFHCAERVFSKLSYRDRPDGLVAVARQQRWRLEQLTFSNDKPPLLLVAEAIEKPGNLGTMLRSCDATGVDALIVCDRCTDLFNPNVVRASVGTLFSVPCVETTSQEALAWLFLQQIPVVATTPAAQMAWHEAPLSGATAIVVGTEQLGLSSLWLDQATWQVSLPMAGIADSLNVATSAGLLLYEAVRQRTTRH